MSIIIYIEPRKQICIRLDIDMKTNLRKFRFERGELSQQQLADMVSVSRQTIVSIERGDYAPSVKLALLLAVKLETTVEQLFQLEEKDYA